ncbi:hypothetical protein FQN55_006204 [Onygenales sp. PD_40]|nr:hypothetical protein FQN55_006204 [Onygenales sp. PD_40]
MNAWDFLARRQGNIRELWLKTDPECSFRPSDNGYLPLTTFKSLRLLSWRGISLHRGGLETLRDWFGCDLGRVSILELSFGRWQAATLAYSRMRPDAECRNFVYHDILNLKPGQRRCRLPSLVQLKVDFDFHDLKFEMAYAFNFEKLRKLSFWNCPRLSKFLGALVGSNFNLQLSFLEICGRLDKEAAIETDFVTAFIKSFTGLRSLCLFVDHQPSEVEKYVEAIVHHKDTLKNLVYDVQSLYTKILDSNDIPPPLKYLHVRAADEKIEDYFVEDTAVAEEKHRNDPQYVDYPLPTWGTLLNDTRLLVSMTDRPRVRCDFLQWAFGPEAFPNLEIVAFGDATSDDSALLLFGHNSVSNGSVPSEYGDDYVCRNFVPLGRDNGVVRKYWRYIQSSHRESDLIYE